MVFARLPTETAQCGPRTSPWRQRRVPTVAAVITRGVPLPDWYPICQFYFSVAWNHIGGWLSMWVVLWRSLVNPLDTGDLVHPLGHKSRTWFIRWDTSLC